MQYTKEDILKNIEQAFYQCCEKNHSSEVLLTHLIDTSLKTYEAKDAIFALFDAKKYTDVIRQHIKFEIYTPEGKAPLVREKQKTPQTPVENNLPASSGLYDRIRTLLNFLNAGLYEKEKVTRLVLLSTIAGESMFLLGPPGTAKSMIARRLTKIFNEDQNSPINYFEYLLNEFTTPDELFGPVSLNALNNDEYTRKTASFLPSADIAFLDEIWKAGPAILNTLLTIINEKKFHNGNKIDTVPLKALVAASNELPAQNKGLEALWDRFIMRVSVEPIGLKNTKGFFKMTMQSPDSEQSFIPNDTIKEQLLHFEELCEWQTAVTKIGIPDTVQQVIIDIRQKLAELNMKNTEIQGEKYYISDRRWKHILHLVRTSAYLHGRTAVDLLDAALIAECIWSTESQRLEVQKIVGTALSERGISGIAALGDIEEHITHFRNEINTTWYDAVEKTACPAAPLIVEHEGKQFYQAANQAGTSFYFEVPEPGHTFVMQYNEHWALPKKIMIDSFSADKKTLTASGEVFTLVWKNAESAETVFEKKKAVFDDAALYEKLKKDFDEKHYRPIAALITQEKEKIKQYQQQKQKEFSAHLFADVHYARVITEAINKTLKAIEDAELLLDKEHARYEKRD